MKITGNETPFLEMSEEERYQALRDLDKKRSGANNKKLTPIKAIRAKCLDCCCWQVSEVRNCHITSCALHPYRMGHRPKLADDLTTEDDETGNSIQDDGES